MPKPQRSTTHEWQNHISLKIYKTVCEIKTSQNSNALRQKSNPLRISKTVREKNTRLTLNGLRRGENKKMPYIQNATHRKATIKTANQWKSATRFAKQIHPKPPTVNRKLDANNLNGGAMAQNGPIQQAAMKKNDRRFTSQNPNAARHTDDRNTSHWKTAKRFGK